MSRTKHSHKYIHLAGMVIWALLVIPTMLFWKESVLVVLFYSIYANFAGHWSGYEGAKAQDDAL